MIFIRMSSLTEDMPPTSSNVAVGFSTGASLSAAGSSRIARSLPSTMSKSSSGSDGVIPSRSAKSASATESSVSTARLYCRTARSTSPARSSNLACSTSARAGTSDSLSRSSTITIAGEFFPCWKNADARPILKSGLLGLSPIAILYSASASSYRPDPMSMSASARRSGRLPGETRTASRRPIIASSLGVIRHL